jgi:hypothetical protein
VCVATSIFFTLLVRAKAVDVLTIRPSLVFWKLKIEPMTKIVAGFCPVLARRLSRAEDTELKHRIVDAIMTLLTVEMFR